ncbi:hypothetical protein OKW42_004587 [Paraburkholderia sp. WC7.3d]
MLAVESEEAGEVIHHAGWIASATVMQHSAFMQGKTGRVSDAKGTERERKALPGAAQTTRVLPEGRPEFV